jgi:GNAT superfamily N-acetyltransferase
VIVLSHEDPGTADAGALVDELSHVLERLTGSTGRASSDLDSLRGPQACFAVARDLDGRPLGCGAFRVLALDREDAAAAAATTAEPRIVEIKRMYARPGTRGVGTAVLAFLEAEARGRGYTSAWLETRRVNARAVAFYASRGYRPIPNYGRYAGNDAAVCLGKALVDG